MSLGNLLSVGRSVRPTREDAGRYKLADQRVLPKFAPVGRAISLAPQSPVPAPKYGRYAAKCPVPTAAETAPAQPGAMEQMNLKPVNDQPSAGTSSKRPGLLARWNPLLLESRRQRPLIQTELRLDSVKVVRNDLSDADLELVPVPRSIPGGPKTSPSPAAGGSVTIWNWFMSKFFCVGKLWR